MTCMHRDAGTCRAVDTLRNPRLLSLLGAAARLLFAALLLPLVGSSPCLAQAPAPAAQAESPPSPGLAELVPKARELSEKKELLDARIAQITALQVAEATLAALRERYAASAAALQSLEAAGDYTLDQLTRLKASFREDLDSVDAVANDLSSRIEEIESDRKHWAELGILWKEWEAQVPENEAGPTVRITFAEARAAAAHASSLLSQALPKVVPVQRDAVELQARFHELQKKVEGLIEAVKGGLFGRWSPPMLSPQFRQQVAAGLRAALAGSPAQTAGLRTQVSPNWGWFVLLHVCLAASFAFALRWPRVESAAGQKWSGLLERPFAAGILAGALLPLVFYLPVQKLPATVAFVVQLAAAVAAVRLAPRLIGSRGLRRTLFVIVGVFLLSNLLRLTGLPTPLLRVYNALIGAVGAPLCFVGAERWRKRGEPRPLVLAGRVAGVLFAFACVGQVSGYSSLGFRLVDGLVLTIFLLPLSWMFSLLLRGSAELLLERGVLTRWASVRNRRSEVLRTLGFITDGATLCLLTSLLLVIWRFLDSPREAIRFLLGLGFSWGEQRFTLGLVLAALVLLYLSLAFSRVVQAVLEGQVYPQRRVDPGAQISINRLIHYGFILVGVLLALGALGIGVGKLAVLAGALGVGIGFGLQTIVNNFVSGLILLSERPIKVGDVLQLGTDWGKVTQLGLRATTIQTFDRSEIIVPNSELIAGRVVNWTHSDRGARLLLPVSVAYGTDVALVMRVLEEVAAAHLKVASDPKPEAHFMAFGESSLDFRLMAWVWDIEDRLKVQSDLLAAIDQRFREAGIEIPFPQHVVHLAKAGSGRRQAEAKEPGAAPDMEV